MQRAEGDLIDRETELTKTHTSIPRHPINGDEYFSPTEIGNARDDLVKAAQTASPLFTNRFYDGPHVRPSALLPEEIQVGHVKCTQQ